MGYCRDKYAAEPKKMFQVIKGGGDLCIEGGGVHVSGRAMDDQWAEASGKQVAQAIQRLMDVCGFRGGELRS
jgi:hypothetical protein